MARGDQSGIRAGRAAQVLENPEFQAAFDSARETIVSDMERLELDGANDAAAAALIHRLQATTAFKAELVRLLQSHDRELTRAKRHEAAAKHRDGMPPNH